MGFITRTFRILDLQGWEDPVRGSVLFQNSTFTVLPPLLPKITTFEMRKHGVDILFCNEICLMDFLKSCDNEKINIPC